MLLSKKGHGLTTASIKQAFQINLPHSLELMVFFGKLSASFMKEPWLNHSYSQTDFPSQCGMRFCMGFNFFFGKFAFPSNRSHGLIIQGFYKAGVRQRASRKHLLFPDRASQSKVTKLLAAIASTLCQSPQTKAIRRFYQEAAWMHGFAYCLGRRTRMHASIWHEATS